MLTTLSGPLGDAPPAAKWVPGVCSRPEFVGFDADKANELAIPFNGLKSLSVNTPRLAGYRAAPDAAGQGQNQTGNNKADLHVLNFHLGSAQLSVPAGSIINTRPNGSEARLNRASPYQNWVNS